MDVLPRSHKSRLELQVCWLRQLSRGEVRFGPAHQRQSRATSRNDVFGRHRQWHEQRKPDAAVAVHVQQRTTSPEPGLGCGPSEVASTHLLPAHQPVERQGPGGQREREHTARPIKPSPRNHRRPVVAGRTEADPPRALEGDRSALGHNRPLKGAFQTCDVGLRKPESTAQRPPCREGSLDPLGPFAVFGTRKPLVGFRSGG
jgi:hypothetical protein